MQSNKIILYVTEDTVKSLEIPIPKQSSGLEAQATTLKACALGLADLSDRCSDLGQKMKNLGKKNVFKEYNQFNLNTCCFWQST